MNTNHQYTQDMPAVLEIQRLQDERDMLLRELRHYRYLWLRREEDLDLPGCALPSQKERQDTSCPCDMGGRAYRQRETMQTNPYKENDWRYEEWLMGWKMSESYDIENNFDWSTNTFKDV